MANGNKFVLKRKLQAFNYFFLSGWDISIAVHKSFQDPNGRKNA